MKYLIPFILASLLVNHVLISKEINLAKCKDLFIAGPDNPELKKIYKVRTTYSGHEKCPASSAGIPCLKSLVEIKQQPRLSRVMEKYYKQESIIQSEEGSSAVPKAVNSGSIDVFQFPFSCDPNDPNSCSSCQK